jgi:6-phosphogluconolactonase (cycloisomerase 2 family)
MKTGLGKGFRFLALAFGLAAAMAGLSGCGKDFFSAVNNNPGGTGSTSFVYVTNVDSSGSGGTLTAYSLASGVLTQLSGSPYTLTATPTSIAVAPNNAFLYVGTNLGIFLFTIASDGTLTEGNSSTIIYLGPTQPQALTVDATSSWLIIANQNSTELDALAIDPTTGIPPSSTPVSISLATGAAPQQVTMSPANDNIFVAEGAAGTDAIGFSPTGKTTFGTRVHIGMLKTSTASNAVAVDSTSTYLYIAENTSNQLRLIAIADLTKDVADYPTGQDPVAILPDLSGSYVYVSNATDNTITGFSFSAGALTALVDSPFATAKTSVGLVEDSSKSYILDAGFGNNPNLWVYKFDGTSLGTLDVTTTTSTASADPSLANGIAITH